MNKEHKKSLGNDMPKPIKCIYYAVTLFGNEVWNKIPSRHLRRWYYQMLGANFGKNTYPCRRVEVLLSKTLKLGESVAVGWFAELDARGGITVEHDTNILQGVTIGNGAVVVAGAVVTKDIPPYEVWRGYLLDV